MNINEIKHNIEKHLKIYEWHPSDKQIIEIYNRFTSLPYEKQNIDSLAFIVGKVYGSYTCLLCNSIDNSDIKAIIQLATIKAENESEKSK